MSTNEPAEITQQKARIAGVFDRAASTYDQLGPQIFAHLGRRLVEFAQIASGATVLDVATGRGAVLFPAVAAVGRHGHVTGIDISAAMVGETASEIELRGIASNAAVAQMDSEHLDFLDASFDYALCGLSLFFFPQLNRAMAELRRVLKPAGKIAVTTWDKSFSEHTRWLDELVSAYLPPAPSPSPPAASTSGQQPVFDTPEGLAAILQAAGFADIQVRLETNEIVYTTAEEHWSALWSHGMRGKLEQIEQTAGADGLQRFKTELLAKSAEIQQPDGIHQLTPVLFAIAVKPGS